MLSNNNFNGERLKAARIYRGVTIMELADKIGVSKQMVSKYENNKSVPAFETMLKIIEVLDFPKNYFFEEDIIQPKVGNTYFRSLFSTSKKDQLMQTDRIKFLSIIHQFLEKYIDFPKIDIPDFNDCELTDIEAVSKKLRKYWGLADEPIPNMIRLLEKKGLIVASTNTNSSTIDAFSQKQEINGKEYFFVILGNDKGSAVRRQFDAAHELGHIILHDPYIDLGDLEKEQFREIEREANDFAAALLLPQEAFRKDIINHPVDLENYLYLKRKWKVSVSAMTVRAYKIGAITQSQYQYLQRKIVQKGWRRSEPLDDTLTPATPLAMKKAIELLIDNNILMADDIVKELSKEYKLSLHPHEIEKLLNLKQGLLTPQNIETDNIVNIKDYLRQA